MKYSLVSPKAFKDKFKKAKLFKIEPEDNFSGWVILGLNEDEQLLDEDGRHLMIKLENDAIEGYLSDFKNIQNAKVDTIYVHNTGFDKLVEINRKSTKTVDDTTYATNQSDIEVDFKQWFKYNKREIIEYYLLIAFGVLIFPVGLPISAIISGIIIWIFYNRIKDYKTGIKEHYEMGDTLPGIIVGLKPTKVAVMTDFSKGMGYYPIIKVVKFKFKTLNGKKVEIGDKLPMAALYSDGGDANHWADVTPQPIAFATKDKDAIGKKTYSISMDDWNLLKYSLNYINTNKVGIYELNVEGNSWNK